ncbi:hypothetical protein ACQ4M3_41490 [Leptolyngbya sp. AN03gr2]|uniref:hypothetical protein n=1 Tax=unclassified Leptolyngbya TaxID=2650499 RepID=UPI003D311CFC
MFSGTQQDRKFVYQFIEKERIKAMQRLANAPDRQTYLALQQEIAQQLNMTVRNVQLLMKAWQTEGVDGILRRERSGRAATRRLNQLHSANVPSIFNRYFMHSRCRLAYSIYF